MKKICLLITLLVIFYYFSTAQTASVRGVILDTINQKNLTNAYVSLLRPNDSGFEKITYSNIKGIFELRNVSPGYYLLAVTHPGYEKYICRVHVHDTATFNIGTVRMTLKSIILKEVILRRQISALKLSGDTIEFNANSFKVREGASVEDLLKKLPGIQVDKHGNITAMGKKVNKIYVDGEEFFGNDPKIASKNLPADAVYKVQVFDKKSEQATFTGIDDGTRSKTINLQLKKDKKKGNFGKLDLGAGLNGKWNNSVMINSFKDKVRLSAYGTMSSTDVTAFNQQQTNQNADDNDLAFNNNFGSFGSLSTKGNNFNNNFSYGDGLPKSYGTGFNYSNKFNDDQQDINGSYRYSKMSNAGSGSTLSQSILPDTVFFNREAGKMYSSSQKHYVNGSYEWQVDKSTSIKIRANGYTGVSNAINSYRSESQNKFGNLVNNSMRNTIGTGDEQGEQSSLLIRKKFERPGRTISVSVGQNYSENKTNGSLYALDSFFDKNGIISLIDTTDQKKVNESLITRLNGKIVYTEPISKNFFAELHYAFQSSRSDMQRLSFDKNVTGKYVLPNDSLSNHYNFNVFTNVAGVAFKYNGKNILFSFGSNIGKSNFNQKDLLSDTTLKRDFTNFFPKADFTFKFSQNRDLSITYNGYSRQPSISQVQPVADNTNPLNIIIGNPFLRQEFDHNVNFNFNSFNLSKQRGVFLYGSFSLLSNAIVTNNSTDALGRAVYKYVNATGNYNLNSGFNYFINIATVEMNLNTGLNFNKSSYHNVVNDKNNITGNNSIALNFAINKGSEKKYNFYYYGNFCYNVSTSSIRGNIQTKYWTQEHNFGLSVSLPWKFEVNNELQSNLQQRTVIFGGNNNQFLWNAYFGKKLLKNDKAIIKIIAHNILNENTGYGRYIGNNVIQQSNYENIARYFLLNFTWNFFKSTAGTGKTDQ